MNFDFKSPLMARIALAGVALLALALGGSGAFTPDTLSQNAAAQTAPPPPTVWKEATPAQRSAAAASIRAQLDAFRKGQWDKAVSYQSSTLKRNFASTAAFRSMMKNSYPQFVNSKSVTFGAARAAGPRVQIVAELTGNDGVKVGAIYLMIKEKVGYRVDGVSGGATAAPKPVPRRDDGIDFA